MYPNNYIYNNDLKIKNYLHYNLVNLTSRMMVKLGAEFVLTKDFMFNLNAEYGLATYGDEISYGGGFRWQF
tara:strand:+ start:210 stop:422 length:213 start_codon:yes stop_codon:yes gene_type:complete